MILRRLALIVAAVFALAIRGPAAHACSTSGDYVTPSNFELVQIADAIVVATANAGRREASAFFGTVRFTVDRILKGAPPRRVDFELASIGPGGGIGMCVRSGFEAGRPYILFLERGEDGGWRRVGMPFTPDAADYDGENGTWTRTVRRYLALQQRHSPMDALLALQRMAETGIDADGRALAADEREDIYDHLRSVSPWKPTAWLLEMYGRLERGEPPRFPLPPRTEQSRATRVDLRESILRALALGNHPEALPFFERLSSAPGSGRFTRGPILRYFANHGHYDRAYEWIETRLMTEVVRLPEAQARALLVDVAEVQRGDSWDDAHERWRSDPRAAASWPELALLLYWYYVRTFSDVHRLNSLTAAIRAIPLSDRRARPEVTAALGDLFDSDTRDWATAELAKPQRAAGVRSNAEYEHPADRLADHPDLLPLRVIASAWVHEDREALTRAFCDGGDRRRLVIHALGQWGDDLYDSLLSEFAAAPELSAEDLSLLRRAAILMAARQIGAWGTAGLNGDREGGWPLSLPGRGEQPASLPDPCRAVQ